MSLKPAHLSYKCTVCTATFGMYKQFENHVYSAHSNVAKNSSKKTLGNQPASSSSTSMTSTPKVCKVLCSKTNLFSVLNKYFVSCLI